MYGLCGSTMLFYVRGLTIHEFWYLRRSRLCRVFIHLSTDGLLIRFHPSAIVNNAAVNRRVQVSFWCAVFISFECILRSGIAGSNNSVFNFFMKPHAALHYNGCTNLHSHQQCTRVLFFPYPSSVCYLLSFW